MRKLYWYLTAYIRKHGFVLLGSLVGGIIIFSFLLPGLVSTFAQKPRHYIGLIGEYTLQNLPNEVKQEISVGLTQVAQDGSAQPYLAERWIVEDEGKTYRFILKKDVRWQDGQVVVPDSVQYQFADALVVTTPNDIIFKLPDRFVPFPTVVAEPVIRYGTKKRWFFIEEPSIIGIGPNQVMSFKRMGNRLTELVVDAPDERNIYRFYLTEPEAITAFKLGQVDSLPDLTDVGELETWKTVDLSPHLTTNRYLALFFNNSSPLLSKNMRQAISYAVTKPSGVERALGPINPQSWAYLRGGKAYDKDIPRGVERMLDELPPEKLDLELATTPAFEVEAELIRKELEELGVAAVVACQSAKTVTDKGECGKLAITVRMKISNFPDTSNFQLLLIGQESPPDPDQYFLWHSEQPTNFTHYKNTRIDSLLEKGRQTTEQNERLAVYQEFQQFLLEDPPAVFIRHLSSFAVNRK